MLGASEVTDLEGEPTTMILLKQRKPYNNPNNLSVCPQRTPRGIWKSPEQKRTGDGQVYLGEKGQ